MARWKKNEIIYNDEVTINKFQHRCNITQLLIGCCALVCPSFHDGISSDQSKTPDFRIPQEGSYF